MSFEASRRSLAICTITALAGCAVDIGEGAELDDLYAGGGFHAPDPLKWTRTFKDSFDGQALSAGWINLKGAPASECYRMGGGRLAVLPRNRERCYYFHEKVFGPTGHFLFAAKIKLSQTRGHFSSFWVRHAPGSLYNELDVIESFGKIARPDRSCEREGMKSTSGKGWYGVQNVFYSSDAPIGRVHCFGKKQMESLQPYDGNFHIFSMEWKPGSHVTFAMDGTPTAEFGEGSAVAQAVQMSLTNFLGDKVASGAAELEGEGSHDMEVEWVKVWEKDPPGLEKPVAAMDLERDDRSVVDPAFYLALYPDLQAAFGSDHAAALDHWLTYGINEGRVGSPTFDLGFYRATHPDLQALDNMALVDHFLEWGLQEGRVSSPFFDVASYVGAYSDLAAAFGADRLAAAHHFLQYGIAEGRLGAATFNAPWYLSANPDVAAAYGATNYLGAMVHWQVYGRTEGRPGAP